MKNFSTAALLFLFALVPQAVAKARCEFLSSAPDSHLVKSGDTLWHIAATFLENPWCWSTVWEVNRSQIRDPHWIYPGQTIHFDRQRQQLSLHPGGAEPVTRRSPLLRTERLPGAALPVIPQDLAIRLRQSALISADTLTNAPRVASLKDGRRMAVVGDTIFVSGALEDQTLFQVIRPSQRITDPDTKQPLALTSQRIGRVSLQRAGNDANDAAHQFKVMSSDTEIIIGDCLIPWINLEQQAWSPHPAPAVTGRIAAVLRGATWASVNDVVAINRGAQHGLDAGSVIAVVRRVKIHADVSSSKLSSFPTEEIAALLVFDVADTAALAVVMRASDTFTMGDAIESVDRNAR